MEKSKSTYSLWQPTDSPVSSPLTMEMIMEVMEPLGGRPVLEVLNMRTDKSETNRRTEKLVRKTKDLSCSICPPNRGENAKRRPKYGRTKPKDKR